MSKLRVAAFSLSVDGFGAGPGQSLDAPLGQGGEQLHQWFFPTRTFQRMANGRDEGETGIDDDFAARGFENVGASIVGRNMFGPVRGPWPDDAWKGWWGSQSALPHARLCPLPSSAPAAGDGGRTVFHFVNDGIEAALARARQAAAGRDVRVGGRRRHRARLSEGGG